MHQQRREHVHGGGRLLLGGRTDRPADPLHHRTDHRVPGRIRDTCQHLRVADRGAAPADRRDRPPGLRLRHEEGRHHLGRGRQGGHAVPVAPGHEEADIVPVGPKRRPRHAGAAIGPDERRGRFREFAGRSDSRRQGLEGLREQVGEGSGAHGGEHNPNRREDPIPDGDGPDFQRSGRCRTRDSPRCGTAQD